MRNGSSAGLAALLSKANGDPIRAPYIFSRPEWAALVVPKTSNIRTLADLRGKKIAATKGTDPCPVYMGVASGIRGVDRKLVEVARLYRLGSVELARRVLLPAALPAILTGLRNRLSLAWMFMAAAELIAASRGLGYLLSDGRDTGRADIVLAAIVLLAALAGGGAAR